MSRETRLFLPSQLHLSQAWLWLHSQYVCMLLSCLQVIHVEHIFSHGDLVLPWVKTCAVFSRARVKGVWVCVLCPQRGVLMQHGRHGAGVECEHTAGDRPLPAVKQRPHVHQTARRPPVVL